jgi:hypothetical protein
LAAARAASRPPERPAAAAEPPAAAAFLAAYARGDELAAEAVASPLYRAEWERQGFTPADRAALLPASLASGPSGEWIHFTYRGGVVSADFGHLLYTAQPAGDDASVASSVWRVDTAPDGRVIWAELVWRFGVAGPVEPADVARDLPPAAFPPELAALHPRPLAGVRSVRDREAYYLAEATVDGRPRVMFFARDENGYFRPGAWSYGQDAPAPSTYGQAPTPHPVVPIAPEIVALERDYAATLR